MKNQLSLALLFCLFFFGCKKSSETTSIIGIQSTKTTDIKLGEPIMFTILQISGSDSVKWNVIPSINVEINANGNSAVIAFGNSGRYTVFAQMSNRNFSNTVIIDTAYYSPPVSNDLQPIATDDDILITPSLVGVGDSVAIQFMATTTKKYNCLNNFLLSQKSYPDGQLKLSYTGIGQAGLQCNSGSVQAISNVRLAPFNEGTNLFKIVLNGIEYNGSVVKAGRNHVFTWQYNSKVIFSKLTAN